ncbi:MAG: Nramp family divalent metal transporter [Hyphomicrobiales bacterium]|nr:Nramp family divalent metal transporter [Hyphomicrobiales bacterium]MDE2115049.1 Nramp family divalent metal transporter [Hyphomicrobiales bacterium]
MPFNRPSPLLPGNWANAPEATNLTGSNGIAVKGSRLRRFMALVGPGYLVATGYMDPGNWATSLGAGSQFGNALLYMVVLSSLMAILLQALSVRLAIGMQQDLAQACRAALPRILNIALWLLMEIAIISTDLAEVIGTAIGLQLLLGIPMVVAVLITIGDVVLIFAFQRFGFRKLEAFVGALLVMIAGAFAAELYLSKPDWHDVASGLVPHAEIFHNSQMLYLAISIIGATVMPHNFFLHSGLVRTRQIGTDDASKRQALRFSLWDSAMALCVALLVNGAILVLASSAFHAHGRTNVVELQEAYRLIAPLLGSQWAAWLFAISLIACGINSTLTATLAGQIVMEGFIRIRLNPAVRRIITRGIAVTPAVFVALWYGEAATGQLLVFSQVILGLTLPFALVPLVWLTASRKRMGDFVAPRLTTLVAAIIAAAITATNIYLIVTS